MRSVSPDASATVSRTQRASAYVLSPVVSLPGILGVAPVSGDLQLQPAPLVRRAGTAASPVGQSIDRRLALWRADLLAHVPRTGVNSIHEMVFSRAPKAVTRKRMKVVGRTRAIGVIESPEEIDALMAGHDF